jgi:branched-chain amino acid transport system substrate-binding protein
MSACGLAHLKAEAFSRDTAQPSLMAASATSHSEWIRNSELTYNMAVWQFLGMVAHQKGAPIKKRETNMGISRRRVLQGSAGLAAAIATRSAFAATPTIKIGVLADFSGIYNDLLGQPGVECARQAADDFRFRNPGVNVEVVYADHQNKADVGAAIARRWFQSEGVDMLIAGPNSSVGLAASYVTKDYNKVCMGAAVTTSDFTGKQCTPNSINWTYDAYMLSKAVTVETVKAGGKKWYFISTDNAFGISLTEDASAFVKQTGGQVLGSVKCPLGTTDFSSFLLAAQASGADVLGLSVGGSDLTNCQKQAIEFGLTRTIKMAALVVQLTDVLAAGLSVMEGTLFTSSFYWDMDDRTRAFTKRLLPRLGGVHPGMVQAGCYAVTAHYLKACAAMGYEEAKKSGAAAVAKMKEMPTDDEAFGPASIRADGRALIPAYMLRVKAPAVSKGKWDVCQVMSTLSPSEAARPLNEVGCPLVPT